MALANYSAENVQGKILTSNWREWPPEAKLRFLTRLQAIPTPSQEYSRFQARYQNDPVGFAQDCILWGGERPAPYQLDVLRMLAEHDRVAVRGPRGLGKTAMSALVIHWFALTRDGAEDWKIITTASVYRQLADYLWPEIHKWTRRLDWRRIGREPYKANVELMQMRLRLRTGEAMAVTSNKPMSLEGAHAEAKNVPALLYLFEESKIIPDGIWNSVEGAFSTGGKWLAVSTPGGKASRFYKIFSHQPGFENWATRAVTLQEALDAGRVDKEWSDRMAVLWAHDPALYKANVLGEFVEDDVSGIIPLSAVERAQLRWDANADWGPVTSIGVDVGGGMVGSDRSIIAPAHGLRVREVRTVETGGDPSTATMQLAGVLRGMAEKWPRAEIYIDSVGIGLGVLHRLRELGVNAYGFNAGAGTQLRDQSGEMGFANWRAAGFWLLREMMMSDEFDVALPPDDNDLMGELTAPRRRTESTGRIQVEDKAQVRKRVGRSPDKADAVMHALTGPVLIREMGQNRQRIVDATWRVR